MVVDHILFYNLNLVRIIIHMLQAVSRVNDPRSVLLFGLWCSRTCEIVTKLEGC